MRFLNSMLCVALAVVASAGSAAAQDDITALRRQLAEQEALIREQRELLKKQQETLARLSEQIEGMKQRLGDVERTAAKPAAATATPVAAPPAAAGQVVSRDAVGDLNAESVQKGAFPGSFLIPGTRDVSLQIGGFVKTVVMADSNAEGLGSNMLPSTLGTQRNDTEGNFAVDSTLTRLFLDARAPTSNGLLRGYVEYDLNAPNNGSLGIRLRHAYGSWQTGPNTVQAGHTWSTFMDLKILPEGLTEPTVSGAIFQRQAQVRYSRALGESTKVDLAVEDPTSVDVFNNQALEARSPLPDFVSSVEFGRSGVGHVRLGGLVRRLRLSNAETGAETSATSWGLSMGAHLDVFEKDRLAFGATYGEGLGRYMLGLGSTAGGVVDPADGLLKLRNNYSGLFWYRHAWTDKLRSTGAIGQARSQTFDRQPGDAFSHTTYAYGNLMWTILPYLNVGIEYDYGRRTVKDGSFKDNHRVVLGLQVF